MHQGSEYTDIIDLPLLWNGVISPALPHFALNPVRHVLSLKTPLSISVLLHPIIKFDILVISLLLTTPISASQVSMFSCSVLISRALICFT
jgi:hypothetical protein